MSISLKIKEKKKESFPQFFLALCVIRYVSFVKKDKKSNESLSFSDGSNLKVHMTWKEDMRNRLKIIYAFLMQFVCNLVYS